MRTLLVTIVAGSLLVLAPGVGRADTVTSTVGGFAYPSGLRQLTESCTTGTPPTPTALYRRGGARGTHAIGVSFGGATGSESGVETKVASPRSLTSISFATYHPAGPDADSAADGHFAAYFDPSGNDFQDGYYYAYLGLDITRTGWGTWSNLAAASMSWSYWDGATSTSGVFTGTVKQIADAAGSNGSGAWVGFEFGCNGRDYYYDDFRISTPSRTVAYDFEGAQARAYLSTAPSHHAMRVVRDVTSLRLVQGQRHMLWGDALGYGDTVMGRGWLSGKASLYAKPYGASTFRRVGTKGYTYRTWAKFQVTASKRIQYQVRSEATSTHEAAVSRTLTIAVQRRTRARLADSVVRRGRTVQVAGRLFPGDRGVTVVLQRKVGNRWRSFATARSGAGGRYLLRAVASQTGRWWLRVYVGNAKGNLGNHSPTVVLVVKKPRPRPTPVTGDDPEGVTSIPIVIPVPNTDQHIPSDEIKDRALAHRRLLLGRHVGSATVRAHGGGHPTGPVVVQPGVGQH